MSRLECQLCGLPFGYQASKPLHAVDREAAESRDLLRRFGVAAFSWLLVTTASPVLNSGYVEPFSESLRNYLPFLLASTIALYCGYPIHRSAWMDLRDLRLGIDGLLSLAVLSASLFSVVQAFRRASPVPVSTAGAIVTLALAAKLVERIARNRSSRWVRWLHQISPNEVRLLAEGLECLVPADSLNPGQVFLVKAGERFPADGRIEAGTSHADESWLTGESHPVRKQGGDCVIAGGLNLDGVLHVRATHTGTERTLTRVLALAEHALRNRSPLERRVDRVSALLIPNAIVFALLVCGICWIGGFTDFGTALMRAIAVLVVACPCALALGTPLAAVAALGAASRRGVLITDTQVLETLGRVDRAVLDKTGTMTDGRFELLGCEMVADYCSSPAWMQANSANSELDPLPPDFPFELLSTSYEQAFELLASLEQYSDHPLGQDDARTELVARRWESEGRTVTFFGWDGGLHGCLAFGDAPRRNASSLVADLKRRGIAVELVSGDSRATTEAIARQLGNESYYAELLPVQKAELIRELKKNGALIAMVGDGVNDAPALAAADLGIAMGGGTDIAANEASVILLNGDLRKIPGIFDIAHKATTVIRQNLFCALFCNTVGMALAVSGILNPTAAAVLMVLSSVSLAVNSLRLSRPAEQHS
jgi:P-type E1-E2 ATPase